MPSGPQHYAAAEAHLIAAEASHNPTEAGVLRELANAHAFLAVAAANVEAVIAATRMTTEQGQRSVAESLAAWANATRETREV